MALTAITVSNTDHFAKGGVKTLTLAEYGSTTELAYTASTNSVAATGLVLGAAGDTAIIDFEKETAKLTVSGTQEKGMMLFTVSIEAYIPNIKGASLVSLQQLVGKALIGKADFWSGSTYIVGLDNVFGTGFGAAGTTTDFPLFLESIEADSGAALSDQNGVTLKLTAVQGTLPIEVLS